MFAGVLSGTGVILAICLGTVFQEFGLAAQVPHVLTYQGHVASGGTNFSGTGQFKFALVSGGTSAAAPASASASVFFGFVVQITITSGGAGYTTAPAVTITDNSGSGAVAVAQIANGQVVGITVTDAGSGYSASPTITIAPLYPGCVSHTSRNSLGRCRVARNRSRQDGGVSGCFSARRGGRPSGWGIVIQQSKAVGGRLDWFRVPSAWFVLPDA